MNSVPIGGEPGAQPFDSLAKTRGGSHAVTTERDLTPGPNVILVTLIGYHVAGLGGAVVAGVAIFVPSFVLMLSLLPLLAHLERVAWLTAARQGMSPSIIGMIAVALLKVLPTAVAGLLPGVLALATVGAMVLGRVGPVPLMAVGATVGAMGMLFGAG